MVFCVFVRLTVRQKYLLSRNTLETVVDALWQHCLEKKRTEFSKS